MSSDGEEAERELAGNEKGIYTLTSSDLETVADIEKMKTAFVMETDSLTRYQRMGQIKSLLTTMQIFVEKYNFGDYLDKETVEGYTFYQVLDGIDDTEGEAEFIRAASHIAFTLWESCLKSLGVGLPTYRSSVKKKILMSLYSQVINEIDEDEFIDNYMKWTSKNKIVRSNFGFFSYSAANLYKYDLDFNMVWVGKARSSKSTGAFDFVENVYEARDKPFTGSVAEKWCEERNIYDADGGIKALKTGDAEVNLFDESYKTLDRRKSMSRKQVQMTGDRNFYASKKHINLDLIQNFSDMDLRGTTKANAVILNLERGHGLLFADSRFIALARDQFGFEELIQQPSVLKFPPMAIHMLKRQSSYVCELSWKKRDCWEEAGVIHNREADPNFAFYLESKIRAQAKQEKSKKEEAKETSTLRKKIIQMYTNDGKVVTSQANIAKTLNVTSGYVSKVVRGEA